MSDLPPERLPSPDATTGWFAFMPDGSRIPDSGEAWQPPPDGTVIRLMGEHTVPVPLWDEGGLMFSDPPDLVRELGVTEALARELADWAERWHTESRMHHHDAEALVLLERLRDELGDRWRFVYQR